MKRLRQPRRSSRRGAYAVEFGLSFPFFVGFVMGIIDLGWFFQNHMVVTVIARDAARAASLEPLPAQGGGNPETVGVAQCDASLTANGYTGTCTCTLSADPAPDSGITCTVSVPFVPLVGFIPILPANLQALATMRMEEQPL